MPSLRTGAPRRATRLVPLLFGLASASCQSLYGGFAGDNQDNCVVNAALCVAPDQACNTVTRLCEPATLVTAVNPPAGPNGGGTMVTLTGDRFVAGMTVNFDGVPATSVTVNSAQQLTAMTPARPSIQGPVAVELVNPTGLSIKKDKLFRYYGEVTFQQQCFQGPPGSAVIVAADLNGDGSSDLIVAGNSIIRTFLSSGGSFQKKYDINTGQTTITLTAADLNGDGKIDLMYPAAAATNAIVTALGNGDGTFQAPVKTPAANPTYALTAADIDGDKRLDAVSLQDMDIVVQPGRGDGTFLAEQHTTIATTDVRPGAGMVLADLDGDGLLDAVISNSTEQSITVLFGQTGGWAQPLTQTVSGSPVRPFVSDYNQDGLLDIAAPLGATGSKIEFFQVVSGRQLGALPTLPIPPNWRMATQGDFNGDGIADVVTLNPGVLTENVTVYLGIGGGQFVATPPLSVVVASTAATVGDWNGDGQQDLVTVSQQGDSVCTLRTMSK